MWCNLKRDIKWKASTRVLHQDRDVLNAFTEIIEYKCFKTRLQMSLSLVIFSFKQKLEKLLLANKNLF